MFGVHSLCDVSISTFFSTAIPALHALAHGPSHFSYLFCKMKSCRFVASAQSQIQLQKTPLCRLHFITSFYHAFWATQESRTELLNCYTVYLLYIVKLLYIWRLPKYGVIYTCRCKCITLSALKAKLLTSPRHWRGSDNRHCVHHERGVCKASPKFQQMTGWWCSVKLCFFMHFYSWE